MARYRIYQKRERFLIKSFLYICEGLVLVHRHFLKPHNVSDQLKKVEKLKSTFLVTISRSIRQINQSINQHYESIN